MIEIICPECDSAIDNLRYREVRYAYGDYNWPDAFTSARALMNEAQYDSDGDEDVDSHIYFCPNCDDEIDRTMLIVKFEDGRRITINELIAQERNATRPVTSGVRFVRRGSYEEPQTEPQVIRPTSNMLGGPPSPLMSRIRTGQCPIDKTIVILRSNESAAECTSCGGPVTIET